MEDDRYDDLAASLDDLGIKTPMNDGRLLQNAVLSWPPPHAFVVLVSEMVAQLSRSTGSNAGECAISCDLPVDEGVFVVELSTFLSSFKCPFEFFEQDGAQSLADATNRSLIVEFLITELQAVNMLRVAERNSMDPQNTSFEGQCSQQLIRLCLSLNLPAPTVADVTSDNGAEVMARINARLGELVAQVPPAFIGAPLLERDLTAEQWEKLARINEALQSEYATRREMLLKRLDVTVQSFQWSKQAGDHHDDAWAAYALERRGLNASCGVNLYDVAAARVDLTRIVKTSDVSVRRKTHTRLQKLVIGAVPDRGGRPGERRMGFMPGFRERKNGGGGGGAGGAGGSGSAPRQQRSGGGGGGGGGRGGWGGRGKGKGKKK